MTRTAEAVFELRRFRALPVAAGVAVVEVDGRFPGGGGRFTRRPELVLETGRGELLHIAPAEEAGRGERWFGSFAVPVGALDGASYALGVRGALVELPAPDQAEEADRLALLAREANRLRHLLAVAEDAAARTAEEAQARAEAEAALAATTRRLEETEAALEQERELAAQAAEAARADRERLAQEGEEAAAAAQADRERMAAEAEEAASAAAAEHERLAREADEALAVARAVATEDAERLRDELAQLAETREAERAQASASEAALQRRLDQLELELAAREGDAQDLRTAEPARDPQPTQAFTPIDLAEADVDATTPVPQAPPTEEHARPGDPEGEIRARSFLWPAATAAGEEARDRPPRPAALRVLGRIQRDPETDEPELATGPEPAPSPLRWAPVVALALFVVILALLLF